MNIKLTIPVLAAFLLLGTSCVKEIQEGNSADIQNTLSTKLIDDLSGDVVPGNILVKLDAATADAIEKGKLDEISGEILDGIEASSLKPAIRVAPKNTELAKRYGLDRWYVLGFNEDINPQDIAAKVARSSRVRTIQYNKRVEPVMAETAVAMDIEPMTRSQAPETSSMPFNDPHSIYQWNLVNDGTIDDMAVAGADIGVKDAWRLTGGDPSVIVAVFDIAVDYYHPDLENAVWHNEAEIAGTRGVDDDGNGFVDDKYGFNFARYGEPLKYGVGSGHGTHVGGIVAATNNNGKGVSSIAGGTGNGDGVRLMSCQIVQDVAADDASEAEAYIYAADNGACIAQCSYGVRYRKNDQMYIDGGQVSVDGKLQNLEGCSLTFAAIQYFLDPENSNHPALEGNIAIYSAGNYDEPYSLYPGALANVISVTALGCDGLPVGYTNYGPGCNIAAPGGEYNPDNKQMLILSTGTSEAPSATEGLVVNGLKQKQYIYMYGTSMACPHVSGVAALGVSYAHKLGKKFNREDFLSLMLTSVNDIDQHLTGGTRRYYDIPSSSFVDLQLNKYYGKMGTGALDAWKFLMAIEGTPTFMAQVGKKSRIDLSRYCSPHGNYVLSIDEASYNSLGLTSEPVINGGYIEIECSTIGAGKIVLNSSVGKDPDTEDGIGGMDYSREISIISRPFATDNGGWL